MGNIINKPTYQVAHVAKQFWNVERVHETFMVPGKIQEITVEFLRYAKSESFDMYSSYLKAITRIYHDFENPEQLKHWGAHHACTAYSELSQISVLELPSLETILIGFQQMLINCSREETNVENVTTDFIRQLASLVRNSRWKEYV